MQGVWHFLLNEASKGSRKLKSGKWKSHSNYICAEAKGLLTKSLPAVHAQILSRVHESAGLVRTPTGISRQGTARFLEMKILGNSIGD